MTINPEHVRDAVARKDAPGVRDLLREASEADRKVCAKALRPLLRDDPALLERLFSVASMEPLTPENRPPDMPEFMLRLPGAFLIHDHRDTPEGREHAENMALRHSAAFLVLALGLAGGVAEAARLAWEYDSLREPADLELDAIAGVLADRRPPWLVDFVARHLEQQARFRGLGIPAWRLARRLVRLGVIDRPAVAAYTTLMPWGLHRVNELSGPGAGGQGAWGLAATPAEELLADPGLLDDEVWRLFTVPDAAWEVERLERRWPGDEPQPEPGWAESLVTLTEQGHMDRGRLIDACLGAFLCDFAPNRVGWYARLHEQLEPSVAEMSARAGSYLALLGATSTPAIRLGQQAATILLGHRVLDARRLLAASAPTFMYPRKNVVIAQLRLIEKVIGACPAAAEAALVTVAQAFGHERSDIQEAALKLIARHGVPGGRARADISRLAEALSPSLLSQARRLGLGPDESLEPTARPGGNSAVRARGGAHPGDGKAASGDGGDRHEDRRLADLADRIAALPPAQAEPLRAGLARARAGEVAAPGPAPPTAGDLLPEPVRDPAELVLLFTQLIEDARDALAVERAVAGAVRLCHLPAAERRELVGPLLRRAAAKAREDHYGPFGGDHIGADVACLVLAWGEGWADRGDAWYPGVYDTRESIHSSAEAKIMRRILTVRIREACTIIGTGLAAELLAEPEFERGAVSQQRLLERLTCWYRARPGQAPARYDLEGALLRLPPEVDEAFWDEWALLDSAAAARARRMHAEAQQPIVLRPVTGMPVLWHSYVGFTHVLAQADAGQSAPESASWAALTALSRPLADYFRVHGERWETQRHHQCVAGWPLLAPWQPELVAAHLLRHLSDGLKSSRTAATAVSCLTHPGHALGPIGHLALVAGLAAAEADARIAAAGVWAQASLDGRLDPGLAADAIVTGTAGKAFKLNRIADGLRHAASQPIAAYRVVEAICRCAPTLIEAGEPNRHLLLALAADMAATVGASGLPATLTALATRPSTNRSAAAAALLAEAATVGPAPDHAEAVAQSLAALVSRAEADARPAVSRPA
jgi:hypothetical protein